MAPHEDGREAVTHYEVIERFKSFTFLSVIPKTGRTHQIRVHLASLGHPILGDKLYGGNKPGFLKNQRQALHAERLEFAHPVSGKILTFECPIPKDFASFLKIARESWV